MASDTAKKMHDSTAQIQEGYATKDYKITLRIIANQDSYENSKDWMLVMEFRCHDLLRIMQEGLFWTTSNVVPEGGWLSNKKDSFSSHHSWRRRWELREFADRDESQCRWVATATLYGHSCKAVADFRLRTLHRQNVASVTAHNKDGNFVFLYNWSPKWENEWENFNCFIDDLHPRYENWWFWPMEAILDYDTLAYQDGGETDADTKTEGKSLI